MNLNLRSVDLNLLTVFDAIMTEGQLSRAADQLGMTQSAASAALSRLRLTFDDELFIRTRQGMVPTARAEELIQPVREGLSSIREALNTSETFMPETSNRTFKLVLGDYGEILLLPTLIAMMAEQGENMSIQNLSVPEEFNLEHIKKNQIDLYFDFKAPEDENLEYLKVVEEPLVVVARKGHPRLKGKITKSHYFTERHIIYSHYHQQLTTLERFLGPKNIQSRKIIAEVRQVMAIPPLLQQTDGIATVPKGMATYFSFFHDIQVFPFPLPAGKGNQSGYMIWRKALNRDKGHQWFKQLLLDGIKKLRGE